MTRFSISAAGSLGEARLLLEKATPPIDSPTQRSNLSAVQLGRTLGRRARRPEWTWVARDDTGAALGVVAAFGSGALTAPWLIDVIAVRDAEIGAALLRHAIAACREIGTDGLEIIQFAPAEDPLADPDVVAIRALVESVGFRMLVQRRRYDLTVATATLVIPPTTLRFDPAAGPDDPRLVSVMAEILVGSLDAHDLAALAVGDVRTVAEETIAEYLEIDPVESFFLAIDERDEVVGLVVGGLRGSADRGVASFIGVSHLHRGRGYAAQLLGFITARIVADGALTVLGETDLDNFPIARAFTAVGYPQTESRLDFVSAT